MFVVLYFGVQISTRVQLTLALVSAAVVLAFFIKVIIDVGSDNDVATAFNPNSSTSGWSGIFFGVLYGVLIFVGFETAANLAEETAEPKRAIPKAVLTSGRGRVDLLPDRVLRAGGRVRLRRWTTSSAAAAAPLFALGSPESAGRVRVGRSSSSSS